MSEQSQIEASQDGGFDFNALSRAADEAEGNVVAQEESQDGSEEDVESTESQEESQEAVEQEAKEEVAEEDQEPVEPRDNSTRSQLGRKVASIERTLQQTQEVLEQQKQQNELLMALLAQQFNQQQQQQEEPEDDFIPTSKKELARYIERVVEQRDRGFQANKKEYENTYLGTLKQVKSSEEDDDLFESVFELCTKPGAKFNRKVTGNASYDARLNFMEAKTSVLQERLARPKPKENPLKGKQPIAPLGGSSKSTASVKTPSLKKLDDHAKSAARAFGFTADELAKMGLEA